MNSDCLVRVAAASPPHIRWQAFHVKPGRLRITPEFLKELDRALTRNKVTHQMLLELKPLVLKWSDAWVRWPLVYTWLIGRTLICQPEDNQEALETAVRESYDRESAIVIGWWPVEQQLPVQSYPDAERERRDCWNNFFGPMYQERIGPFEMTYPVLPIGQQFVHLLPIE